MFCVQHAAALHIDFQCNEAREIRMLGEHLLE
jgi:hypothetical protein